MLNQCTFIGRLTRKPELRKTPEGSIPVTSFTIAVDRDRPDQSGNWIADFIDFVAWRKVAEKICTKYEKGDLLNVCGRLQIRQRTNREGQKQTIAEIVVTECRKLNITKRPESSEESPSNDKNEEFTVLAEEDANLPF